MIPTRPKNVSLPSSGPEAKASTRDRGKKEDKIKLLITYFHTLKLTFGRDITLPIFQQKKSLKPDP